MKDYEIILWLKNIEPESEKQKKAIEAAERAFYRVINFTPTEEFEELDEFISAYDRNYLINKSSGELYEEYLNYCNDFDLSEVSHKTFTNYVTGKFNLRVVVAKVNGKSARVYKA